MKKSTDQVMKDFIVQLSEEQYKKYIKAALQNDETVLKSFDEEFEKYSVIHSEDKEN